MTEWIGAILLTVCAFPQVVKTVREGNCRSLSLTFLAMWWSGELLLLFHAIKLVDGALALNYFGNSVLVLILIRYKLLPRA